MVENAQMLQMMWQLNYNIKINQEPPESGEIVEAADTESDQENSGLGDIKITNWIGIISCIEIQLKSLMNNLQLSLEQALRQHNIM